MDRKHVATGQPISLHPYRSRIGCQSDPNGLDVQKTLLVTYCLAALDPYTRQT